MAATGGGKDRGSLLLIGMLLGLGLVMLFWFGLGRGGGEEVAEPQPWRVLTVNNSDVSRPGLPIRVICTTDLDGSVAADEPIADCYLRVSLQYNPPDGAPRPDDCQLLEGFVALETGAGEAARNSLSQPVDLSVDDGGCPQQAGVVVAVMFRFSQVDRLTDPAAIRFDQLDPQVELVDNLNFVIDHGR